MMSDNTNGYFLNSFEINHSDKSANFGLSIRFERNSKGIDDILLNYHLMCLMLVLVGSINFLIDPKVVPGRAGLLVTLFLVLTTFFSDAQVKHLLNFNRILFSNGIFHGGGVVQQWDFSIGKKHFHFSH